jgi:DNA-binding beta-propeller fold protein YncE
VALPDNVPLSVVFTSAIASAQIAPGQIVTVGSLISLSATAFDQNGNIVVISPGAFTFSLSGATTSFTITPSGVVTGVSLGSGTVKASINGLTTTTQSVSVAPAFKTFAIDGNDMSYAPSTDTLWVAVQFNSTYSLGAVVPINATTGAMGTPIAVGDIPGFVAVTNDGQYVYAVGGPSTLYQIALATGTVQTVSLPAGDQAAASGRSRHAEQRGRGHGKQQRRSDRRRHLYLRWRDSSAEHGHARAIRNLQQRRHSGLRISAESILWQPI